MATVRILATAPFFSLILLYLALLWWKGKGRIAAIAVAISVLAWWIPVRHTYFLNKWRTERHRSVSVGETVYRCLGHWGEYDEDGLKDMVFLDRGLSHTLVKDGDAYVRYRSAVVLCLRSRVGDQRALARALDDVDFHVRLASAIALWKHNYPHVAYTDSTHCVTTDSLAEYMAVSTLPSVPYGDDDREFWGTFVTKVKREFKGE